MSDLDEFLDHHIDGYVIEDLKTMAKCAPETGKTAGGVGYPMLSTLLAAMELAGTLCCEEDLVAAVDKEEPIPGQTHFVRFWRDFIYSKDSARKKIAAGVYQLVRNGLAHSVYIKGTSIVVGKDFPDQHLTNNEKGETYVDAGQLLEDFRRAYRDFRSSLDEPANRSRAEARFGELILLHNRHVANNAAVFGSLPTYAATPAFAAPSTSSLSTTVFVVSSISESLPSSPPALTASHPSAGKGTKP